MPQVRTAAKGIVQLQYGEDGRDPVAMEDASGGPVDFDRLLAVLGATSPAAPQRGAQAAMPDAIMAALQVSGLQGSPAVCGWARCACQQCLARRRWWPSSVAAEWTRHPLIRQATPRPENQGPAAGGAAQMRCLPLCWAHAPALPGSRSLPAPGQCLTPALQCRLPP